MPVVHIASIMQDCESKCNNFVLRFGQAQPVSYVEHKESLLEALGNTSWPVAYEDVMLLEDEILLGLTYLQQAIELQQASREEPQRICPLRISPPKEVGADNENSLVFCCFKIRNALGG